MCSWDSETVTPGIPKLLGRQDQHRGSSPTPNLQVENSPQIIPLPLGTGVHQEETHCILEGSRTSTSSRGHCTLQERTYISPPHLSSQSWSNSPQEKRRRIQSHNKLPERSRRTQDYSWPTPQSSLPLHRSREITTTGTNPESLRRRSGGNLVLAETQDEFHVGSSDSEL